MGIFNRVLKATKIEPTVDSFTLAKGKVIGFRGVRDGIGTSTLIAHIASELDRRGLQVCVVDLDFQCPNPLMSTTKTESILKKLNHSLEPISNILNRAEYNSAVYYVGSLLSEPIVNYLPVVADSIFVKQRSESISQIIKELSDRFGVILVDIPSDLRTVEAITALNICEEVITLTLCDDACITKLQKDNAILFGIVPETSYTDIVRMDDMFELEVNFKEYGGLNMVTRLARSRNIAESLIKGDVKIASEHQGVRDYNEKTYYSGVNKIIEFLAGGRGIVKND